MRKGRIRNNHASELRFDVLYSVLLWNYLLSLALSEKPLVWTTCFRRNPRITEGSLLSAYYFSAIYFYEEWGSINVTEYFCHFQTNKSNRTCWLCTQFFITDAYVYENSWSNYFGCHQENILPKGYTAFIPIEASNQTQSDNLLLTNITENVFRNLALCNANVKSEEISFIFFIVYQTFGDEISQ